MPKQLTVFGSFAMDLTSRSNGLPVPGQTLKGTAFFTGPGGKGSNQAVAAHRAGANVALVTKLGGDLFGQTALDFYRGEGMRTEHILVDPNGSTGTAVIMVDERTAQNMIVMTPGACGQISGADVERSRSAIEASGLMLAQLEINFSALFAAIDIACAAAVPVALNPAPAAQLPDAVYRKLWAITPNETEARALTGVEVTDFDSAKRASDAFHARGVQNVVVTMGGLGAFASDGRRAILEAPFPANAVDTTGAGDAFNGALATALIEGADLFEAIRFANAAGALSVARPGAAPSMPRRDEIERLLK